MANKYMLIEWNIEKTSHGASLMRMLELNGGD